jgi:hypothetical protein
MTACRRGLGSIALAVALTACTVEGQEVATTFFDPTVNQTGTPPTTGDEDDTESTGGPGGTTGSSGSVESGDTSTPATSTGSGGASTGSPVEEQPEDGMYSECADVGNCIGLTTCVLAGASGFCSNAGCADPVVDCEPNPGATSTAPPACVDNGAGLQVCALSCATGQSCPGGMDCVALGAAMVCA